MPRYAKVNFLNNPISVLWVPWDASNASFIKRFMFSRHFAVTNFFYITNNSFPIILSPSLGG